MYPSRVEDLYDLMKCVGHYYVLGNGSNVLPSDAGFRGTILSTKGLKKIEGEEFLEVGAGVTVSELANVATEKRLTGWEFLVGIPATIGGLVTMNGGAHGIFMSDIVSRVTALTENGLIEYTDQACDFGRKTSRFLKNREVVVSVLINLAKTEQALIAKRKQTHLQQRAFLPKGKSMGCVFQNPQGVSAGFLLSECGLCGSKEGGAIIAKEHANFILNRDNATERDILKLIERMKSEVYRRFDIQLKEEIQYLRDD